MTSQKLSIPTMKCDGCVATVESTLQSLNNVSSVTVDLGSKLVTVEFNGEVDINTLIATVTDAGFPATTA